MSNNRTLFFISINLFFLFTVALPSNSSAGFFSKCDKLPDRDKPNWVKPNFTIQGSKFGVGLAEKKKSWKKQMEASELNALTNLSKSISVRVKEDMRDRMSSTAIGTKEDFSQSVELLLESSVDVNLRDVKVKDRWLDKTDCTLYTMVVISDESYNELQHETVLKTKYNAMMDFYGKATGSNKVLNKNRQVSYIEEAVTLLDELKDDFNFLENQSGVRPYNYYLKHFEASRRKIKNEITSAEQRIFLSSVGNLHGIDKGVVDSIVSQIKSNDKDIYAPRNRCSQIDSCLAYAKNNGFEKAVLLNFVQEIENDSTGSTVGKLRVKISLYNSKTGTLEKKPITAESHIAGWGKETLEWNIAADKIIKSGKLNLL